MRLWAHLSVFEGHTLIKHKGLHTDNTHPNTHRLSVSQTGKRAPQVDWLLIRTGRHRGGDILEEGRC